MSDKDHRAIRSAAASGPIIRPNPGGRRPQAPRRRRTRRSRASRTAQRRIG